MTLDWIGSTVAEAVRAAQDRTKLISWVSLALTFHLTIRNEDQLDQTRYPYAWCGLSSLGLH